MKKIFEAKKRIDVVTLTLYNNVSQSANNQQPTLNTVSIYLV